jgi:hypothetical protein
MSILVKEDYANPETALWAKNPAVVVVTATGNVSPQAFANTAILNVDARTFTAPENGVLVISANVNFANTASSAGLFSARVGNIGLTITTIHYTNLPIGNITSQYHTVSPSISVPLNKGTGITFDLQLQASNGNATPAPTYKWNWTALFYAYPK